jgi:hypothetical protein
MLPPYNALPCANTAAAAAAAAAVMHQVRGLCLSTRGGVPASFLSSQQSAEESAAVKRELRKVRRHICHAPEHAVFGFQMAKTRLHPCMAERLKSISSARRLRIAAWDT